MASTNIVFATGTSEAHTPSRVDLVTYAEACDADESVTFSALDRLRRGATSALAVSGKLGSGKDTVAPTTLDRLDRTHIAHASFAKPLKREFDQILDVFYALRGNGARLTTVADELAGRFNLPASKAEYLVQGIWNLRIGANAYDRDPEVRFGLQYLGTDIRRAFDPDYWTRIATRDILDEIASGADGVMVTDCRFPNEVLCAQRLGFHVPRLEITPETQAARIIARDGKPPAPEAIGHFSEIALDDYQGFNLVVDNNGALEPTVATITAEVKTFAGSLGDLLG